MQLVGNGIHSSIYFVFQQCFLSLKTHFCFSTKKQKHSSYPVGGERDKSMNAETFIEAFTPALCRAAATWTGSRGQRSA
jgi:hypothetical protein